MDSAELAAAGGGGGTPRSKAKRPRPAGADRERARPAGGHHHAAGLGEHAAAMSRGGWPRCSWRSGSGALLFTLARFGGLSTERFTAPLRASFADAGGRTADALAELLGHRSPRPLRGAFSGPEAVGSCHNM